MAQNRPLWRLAAARVSLRVVQAVNDNDDDDYYHILVKKLYIICRSGTGARQKPTILS